jgi:hypothetical protein
MQKKSTREASKEQQKVFLAQDVISAAEKLMVAIKKAREGGVPTTMTTTTHDSLQAKVAAYFHHQHANEDIRALDRIFDGVFGRPVEICITGGETIIDVHGKTIRLWSIGEDR